MKRTTPESHPRRILTTAFRFGEPELVILHKRTGTVRYRLSVQSRSKVSLLRAASLLALHCHARGDSPSDYEVLESSRTRVQEQICSLAAQLLETAGPGISHPRLTRREHEVLAGVAEQLSNKEIAARLNLSERTVKFHISSLLEKFRVRSRMALLREAFGPALVPACGSAQHPAGRFATRPGLAAHPGRAQQPEAACLGETGSKNGSADWRGLCIVRTAGRGRVQ
jgi:DNA-binding CsgD family transcriptional regulator